MVTLTQSAADEIKRQLAAAGGGVATVRLGIEAGGCAGTKYVITPGAQRQPEDREAAMHGLTILCDPASLAAVEGLRIDFVEALMGGGFKFDNPRAAASCGCGASFRTDAAETGNIA
jgi:iron-sulfur cluster assembly protein